MKSEDCIYPYGTIRREPTPRDTRYTCRKIRVKAIDNTEQHPVREFAAMLRTYHRLGYWEQAITVVSCMDRLRIMKPTAGLRLNKWIMSWTRTSTAVANNAKNTLNASTSQRDRQAV